MTEMYSGLHVGQRFSSLEQFKTVIRSISVRQHWELRVIRSNKKSVVIGCRSGTNCYFRVVCRSNQNATYITSLQDTHTCRRSAGSPATTPARSEASHVRFLLNEIPKLFDMKTKIKAQDVVDAVKRYHGYDISMRQAQRALTKLQPRQGEQSMDMNMSAVDQHSPEHSQPESHEEAGSTYREMSEGHWIPDSLSSTLLNEDIVHAAQPPSNHGTAAAAPPPTAQTQPVQPPQIDTPSQSNLSNDPRSMAVSQANVGGYPTGTPLPVPGAEHPKPSDYAQGSEHAAASQMVLTNFKIEFTCTTCGAFNQSFFPNQGNVTGGGFIPHHSVPNQGAVARHSRPAVSGGPDGTDHDVGEDGGYGVNALNDRVMQSAWGAGGLGVPIGPVDT